MDVHQMATIAGSICFAAGGLMLGLGFMLRSQQATREQLARMEQAIAGTGATRARDLAA